MLSPWLAAAAVVAACMTATFAVALRRRDNSIVDVTYGLAFVLATGATFALSPRRHPRETLLLVLVAVWGVRLAAHLLVRKWDQGEDFPSRLKGPEDGDHRIMPSPQAAFREPLRMSQSSPGTIRDSA